LEAELPSLLASLADRLECVVGVGYRRQDWTAVPPQVDIAGRLVELLKFDGTASASFIVIGHDGNHVTLYVIPPETSEEDAVRALDTLSQEEEGSPSGGGAVPVMPSFTDITDRLAKHEGLNDADRTAQIERWCREAATQFATARIQSFVPILIEHIVHEQMFTTRAGLERQ
jgi:hypothetical protein